MHDSRVDLRFADGRINVLGVGISDIDQAEARRLVGEAIDERRRGYVCVTGVHGVTEAQTSDEFKGILNGAFLNTPDGMPMVWMGKLAGSRTIDRVYGPDLMLNLCGAGVSRGWRHFLFGGGEGVADKLRANLEARFPGIRIVGTHTPPFRPLDAAEEEALAAEVAACRPHLFWVGLSTPKQERFMAAHLGRLDTVLMLGVGAAFDFHAGLVPQAPGWIQRSGLEWGFRLCQEPRRLWRRYLRNNPLFIWRICLQLSGLRRYPPPAPATA